MQDAFASLPWAPIPVLPNDLGQVTPLLGPVRGGKSLDLQGPPALTPGQGGPGGPHGRLLRVPDRVLLFLHTASPPALIPAPGRDRGSPKAP